MDAADLFTSVGSDLIRSLVTEELRNLRPNSAGSNASYVSVRSKGEDPDLDVAVAQVLRSGNLLL